MAHDLTFLPRQGATSLEDRTGEVWTSDLSDHPPGTPTSRRRFGSRPRSEWAGLFTLLAVTAGAYLWNLTASGYANTFYAAAVQAGTKSWKAFFFGSLDSSNFITVDKPPASLWVMEIFGRVFGFSSASMLIPEALEGVATVALVYAIVRRWFGHRAGLVAGVVMATMPVAALMFRFNNPDALLVLLLTAAGYAVTRALERGSAKWLSLAAAAVGFAFLAKMGQALLVVPAMVAVYLLAAPVSVRRRIWHLLVAGLVLIVSAGWWVLLVTLWPASDRPMIDGSSTNSIWNLIVGYNGLSRVFASSSGPGGGGGGGTGFSGSTGFFRLFNDLMGGQASWLLPAAAVAMVAGGLATVRRPRTDRTRAALVLWGGWLVVTAAVFSFGQGVIHTYYTVALAPAIAVLVGVGVALLASHWSNPVARGVGAGTLAITALWAFELLDRTPTWEGWLRPLIVIAALVAIAGMVAGNRAGSLRLRKLITAATVSGAAVAGLAAPTAYALDTIGTAHTGSVPSAGPATDTGIGGAGRFRGGFPGGPPSAGSSPGGPASASGSPQGSSGSSSIGRFTGGGGAPGSASQVSSALVKTLATNASSYRWVAATSGSQSAASLELATGGDPVMAIGGFSGQGGDLSLATFEQYVAAGEIHYYIAGGTGGGPGAGSSSSAITSWVQTHFKSEIVGDMTVYDLTQRTT